MDFFIVLSVCVFQVFVEFESVYDADRLGVWYSLLKCGCVHKVDRMKIPRDTKKSKRKQRKKIVLFS